MGVPTLSLALRDGFAVSSGDDVMLHGPEGAVLLPDVPPVVGTALAGLRGAGATEEDLTAQVLEHAGAAGVVGLRSALFELTATGALAYELVVDGAAVAALLPSRRFVYRRRDVDPGREYRLSRFAYLRREGDALVLESPLGLAALTLLDERVEQVVMCLARPRSATALGASTGAGPELARAVLDVLLNLNALVDDAEVEDYRNPGGPAGWWEFHDLVFHARSRSGRHSNPYGGTFHRKQSVPPPPVTKPPMSADVIDLQRPDMAELARRDVPFSVVLEDRRSVREYARRPLSLRELGEFLYRSARVQRVLETGPDDEVLSLRPHPGGGAIHELELYPVVGSCDGLDRGVYHYDPLRHRLERLAAPPRAVDQLLHLAWATADRRSRPQVLIAITARFHRMQWKYESMSYSVVLKNVGVLYQTMYLVATAMRLAPCSLGGGSADLFCDLAGLDYATESQVGEFLLGTRAT